MATHNLDQLPAVAPNINVASRIASQGGLWTIDHDETLFTWANLITVIRTIVGVVLFAFAAIKHSSTLNFMGLGIYWALDVLDGYLARTLNQETRLGAQLDILSDRLLVAFFYLNYLSLHPHLVLPITLFLAQFMGIDHYLSNQFLRWPLLSPNYFYQVDKTIWKLNWSPLAKGINTGLVTMLMVLTDSVWLPALVSVGIMSLKVFSMVRLLRLPRPEHVWIRPHPISEPT